MRKLVSFRRTALASISIAAVAALSAQGCSSKSDSGPPDTAHFAGAMADNFCSSLSSCCGSAHIAYDNGSCVAQMQNLFQNAIDVVKRGKATYDANAVAGCEQAFKDRESKCANDAGSAAGADAGYVDPITAACFGVLKGTVQPGALCTTASECASPGPTTLTSCSTDNDPTSPNNGKDVCHQTTLHVAPGGACTSQPKAGQYTGAACEATLGFCLPNMPADGSGTCTAYANVGDSCISTMGTTVLCNPQTSTCDFANTRQCVAIPTNGQPCPNGQCAQGLYCDSSRTCAQLKSDGSSCQTSQECASRFCQGQTFDGGVLQPGTCASGAGQTGGLYDISPRSCGFGPLGTGPEDGGIVSTKSSWVHVITR